MMILLTLCTLYVFWERKEKKEWNCSLVPFCTLSFPTCFLLSSLLRFLVKDDMWQQAKIPVNKRASPSLPTVCFRAAGKTLRFKSSWSPERVLTGISDCRSRKRKCVRVYVCTRVLKTASVIQTHTQTLHWRRLTAPWLWCGLAHTRGSRCHAPTIRHNQTLLLAALPSPRFCSHSQDHK